MLSPAHVYLAETLYELGRTLLALGDAAAAVPPLERAVEIVDANEELLTVARQARFLLARALVLSGGDRARAIALAEQARAALVEPAEEARAEIDAWLAEQRRGAG